MEPNIEKLSLEQIAVLVGLMLSDGYLERSSPTGNTRLTIQFKLAFPGLFYFCKSFFISFITEEEKIVLKNCMNTGKKYPQRHVRTTRRSVFNSYHDAFYIFSNGKYERVFPTVSFLNQHLNDLSLAVLLMGDGSRKDKHNQGYEIHSQGHNFESSVRLCLALHETLGLECWPTWDFYKQKNVGYWNIYLSASCFHLWSPLVTPWFEKCNLISEKLPIPPKTQKRNVQTRKSAKFNKFLEMFQNNEALRENLYYKLPEEVILEWRKNQKLR